MALEDCFDGLITLTNVTGTQPSEQQAADIVLHYVAHAGGAGRSFPAWRSAGSVAAPMS